MRKEDSILQQMRMRKHCSELKEMAHNYFFNKRITDAMRTAIVEIRNVYKHMPKPTNNIHQLREAITKGTEKRAKQ